MSQLPLLKQLTRVLFSLGWISHEQLLTALLLVTLVGYIHYSRQEDTTKYWNTRLLCSLIVFVKVLGSIPASSDTVEFEVRQMKQCCKGNVHKKEKNPKIPL
jgi:hypothetical protein